GDAQFAQWIAQAIGDASPPGEVETIGRALLPAHPSIDPDGAVRGRKKVYLHGDSAANERLALGPREGMLVLAIRRPDKGSAGQRAAIVLRRYDLDTADLATLPANGRSDNRYFAVIESRDRRAGYELHVVPLAPGTYVI